MVCQSTDPWHSIGVSKRRKVWWIVGGFVVLYSATALYVSWNST